MKLPVAGCLANGGLWVKTVEPGLETLRLRDRYYALFNGLITKRGTPSNA